MLEDPPDDDPEKALQAARERFIAGFARRYEAFDVLIGEIEGGRATRSTLSTLFEDLHRLAGLAGMVGFKTVSERARAFENLGRDRMPEPPDAGDARRALDALRRAFETDCAAEPPRWAKRP